MKSGYRYGFNGKENDNEVKGEGMQQDYGLRIYDNRLGRFLSVDPLYAQFADFSTYNAFANNPVIFIDEDGGSPVFNGPEDGIKTRGSRTIIRVKIFVDAPKQTPPPQPKGGSTLWSVVKFIGKGGLFFKLLLSDANYAYAGPGANGQDENAIKEIEYITSDPSKLDDHYLRQVKRRLEDGTASDQERKYVDEISRRGLLGKGSNEAHNLAYYHKMKSILSNIERTQNFHEDGTLTADAIKNSEVIIKGADLNNDDVVKELTSDGSKISDWNKMSLIIKQNSPAGEKSIDVHFYYNAVTGKTSIYDYKSKLSSNYHKKTPPNPSPKPKK